MQVKTYNIKYTIQELTVRMIKRSIIFSLLVFLSLQVFSQQKTKQFDEDPDKYPEIVAAMFPDKAAEEDKATIAAFADSWNSGGITGNEKVQILRLSNAFLAKKARNIHYLSMWRCVLSFKESGNSMKGYDEWMKAMNAMCEDRRTTPTALQTIMTATQNLLVKRLIFSSAGNDWKTTNNDYRFDFTNGQLIVTFGISDIYCFAKGDSIMIGQTSGRYFMTEQRWRGKGGIVTWERAGFAPGDVSARLVDYTIDMKKTEYTADSVMLTHKTYFPTPVQGKLIDKVRHNQSPETAIYPEFITYNKKFVFENLYPDISYEGGISIQGARTIGAGTNEEKAMIRIGKSDSLRMDVTSKSFVFRSDRINARNVSLNIRMNEDSIFHNNLSFVYLVENKEVSFTRSDAASSQAPYNDSYHKVDMDFEQLVWKTNEPLMNLSMTRGSANGRAWFRSQNYFDQRYFESLQYFDPVHPLISIKKCAEAYYSETFPPEAYASYIKRPIATARQQLIEIAKLGYVTFDSDKDEATIQPRLYDVLSAASKKTDFDVIDLRSSVQTPSKNAQLDTKNYDLIINGIDKIMVSDSQQVVLTPKNQKVVMKKNRSIDFDGRIDAGQLELYGDSLHFDYDTFKIDLFRVDSLYIYVPSAEKDALGKPIPKKLKTAIEKLSGNILIDLPDNKSGRKSLNNYPILESDSASYVFYGSSDIAGGAYNNESFYFELDPFVLDSIDNFSKESLALSGKFVSADIFSDMRQVLRVQPDYSLGFIYESGDSAIDAYNNAKLYAEVRLSNRGLEASGQLDYLTSSIHTDEFKIYPDSMNIPQAKEFALRRQTEGIEFPEVHSDKNKIHWEPKNDKMTIYKHERPFDMYDSKAKFDGNLLLTPQGLSGTGRLDVETADIRSDSIAFGADSFHSDSSLFRLKAVMDGPYQMVTVDSVRSFVDINARRGHFTPSGDYALVQFPANKFAAYVDDFTWDMDSAKVHIGVDTLTRPLKPAVDFKYQYPGEGKGARYYSTARGADSLNFVASSATLDYVSGQLRTEGVKLVKTADALVYPGNGKVTITPDGTLDLIKDARIVFNDTTMQHIVHSANVKISGRHKYSGSGKYDYTDETGKVSMIDITRIESDKQGKTVANGTITGEQGFMISPFYRFQGKMNLSSDQDFAEFDGAAQIVEECETLRPEWFTFKSVVNPQEVKLKVDEAPVNLTNSKIFNGLFLTNDSAHIYPAFFSKRRTYSDNPLLTAHGVLTYDKDSMIYYIASESKLRNRDTVGNMLAFNRDACLLSGEGKISLGIDLGRVKTNTVGRIKHNMNTRETSMDVMIAFDFLFDNGLASMIAGKIDSFPTLPGVDMVRPRYIRGMNEWLGVEKAVTFRRDAMLGKVKNFPAELNHTLVLTQLKLQWDQSSRSYRSSGKIGVGNLFGHQVNRLVDGMVEITKRPGGDFMDIYLKLDDRNWFYFGYTRELMQVISSDQAFNDRLVKLPEKQRKSEEKRPGFTYMIASSDKLEQFLRQYQRQDGTVDAVPKDVTPAPSIIQDVSKPVQTPAQGTPPAKKEEDVPIIEIE